MYFYKFFISDRENFEMIAIGFLGIYYLYALLYEKEVRFGLVTLRAERKSLAQVVIGCSMVIFLLLPFAFLK